MKSTNFECPNCRMTICEKAQAPNEPGILVCVECHTIVSDEENTGQYYDK